MKIVRFPNGDFAIRRWSFGGFQYYDLKAHAKGDCFWWTRGGAYFPDCADARCLHVMAIMQELEWWRNPIDRFYKRFGKPIRRKRQTGDDS